jgi:hypothetical protein
MTALALTRPRGLTALAVALSLVAGALVSFGVSSALLSGGDPIAPASHTAPGRAFTVAIPSGWHSLSPTQLKAMPGSPAAVVRSPGGRGIVIVRHSSAVRVNGPALARQLATRLRARFPGFHAVGARIARVRGGSAFVYTFVRDPKRTAQTVAFAAARGRAYEIDAVVRGGSPATARDAAAIIASFGQ